MAQGFQNKLLRLTMRFRALAHEVSGWLGHRSPQRRTIILLSAKRTGSTALFQVFRNHPDVGTCYKDPSVDNWEPNFWNYAARAINGDAHYFVDQFARSHPFLQMPSEWNQQAIFRLWDEILRVQGPIVFDKSPKYLQDVRALEMIRQYRDRGNDVRVFGLIRDPRDAIASQYTLWHSYVEDDSPQRREKRWLAMYAAMEDMQQWFGSFPVFRYEDIANQPAIWMPRIFEWCGLRDIKDAYAHIKPVHVGRHRQEENAAVRDWEIGDDMKAHLLSYGYCL